MNLAFGCHECLPTPTTNDTITFIIMVTPHSLSAPQPSAVPGGPGAEAAGGEEGACAGGSPQGSRGEQHL